MARIKNKSSFEGAIEEKQNKFRPKIYELDTIVCPLCNDVLDINDVELDWGIVSNGISSIGSGNIMCYSCQTLVDVVIEFVPTNIKLSIDVLIE